MIYNSGGNAMEYKIAFDYLDNAQVKQNFKQLLKVKGYTMKEVSEKLGLSTPQQLNNKFNNKRLSLDDLNEFLRAVGCTLEISFKDAGE